MKWWEFTQDNGDGSYSKKRYRTEKEAKEALTWFEENVRWWQGDGDGVTMIDTESGYFWDSFDNDKRDYGRDD